jgi:A/G-specific adenine glycosylase
MLPDHLQLLEFNAKLKSWYFENHRPLLWRQTKDPYKIWLSEIILQQTRVAQGTPYYEKFLINYPTIFDLAAADERDILRLWQGLGYYSRARNMHHTARHIVETWEGRFPESAVQLAKLKGLGAYTAAAIASFSFGEAVPAIDGNVYRVMSRLFGIHTDILSSGAKKEFTTLANQVIPREDPATYNQAMIELGALQCVPVSPNCSVCPFTYMCYAYAFDMQNKLPVKMKKNAVRNRYFNYFILEKNGKIAMHERVNKDIWKGLYDFYLVESTSDINNPDDLPDDKYLEDWKEKGRLRQVLKEYTHLLTHQRLTVRFWWVTIPDDKAVELPGDMEFYTRNEIEVLPKPILMDTLLREEFFL